MMRDEPLERLLARLPVRELGPQREAELIAALHAGATGARHASWWARRVPLWQAAAACLLIAGLTGLAGRAPKDAQGPPVAVPGTLEPVVIRVEAPILASRTPASYAIDVRQWSALSPGQGENE